MKETEDLKKRTITLSDDELEKVAGGTDTESLRTSGKPVPLPEARYKKDVDGGYAGNTAPNLPPQAAQ